MKFKTFLSTAFLLAIIFPSCKKDRQKNFPSETTIGANTFGCYIDKNQFLPCKTTGGISPVKKLEATSYYYDANHIGINISAVNDCDNGYTYGRYILIQFDSIAIATNTTYKFGNFYDTARNNVSCMYSRDLIDYTSDSSLNGSLTVTYYDNVKKIMSGKFEATLKNTQGTETVNLTTGIFDVTF